MKLKIMAVTKWCCMIKALSLESAVVRRSCQYTGRGLHSPSTSHHPPAGGHCRHQSAPTNGIALFAVRKRVCGPLAGCGLRLFDPLLDALHGFIEVIRSRLHDPLLQVVCLRQRLSLET